MKQGEEYICPICTEVIIESTDKVEGFIVRGLVICGCIVNVINLHFNSLLTQKSHINVLTVEWPLMNRQHKIHHFLLTTASENS